MLGLFPGSLRTTSFEPQDNINMFYIEIKNKKTIYLWFEDWRLKNAGVLPGSIRTTDFEPQDKQNYIDMLFIYILYNVYTVYTLLQYSIYCIYNIYRIVYMLYT